MAATNVIFAKLTRAYQRFVKNSDAEFYKNPINSSLIICHGQKGVLLRRKERSNIYIVGFLCI